MTMAIDTRGAGGTAMGPNEAKLIMALTQDDASLEQTSRALQNVRAELQVIQDELSRSIAPELEGVYPSAGGRAAAEATRRLGHAVQHKLAEVESSMVALDRVRGAYAAAEQRRGALPPVGLPPVPSTAAREEMAEGTLGPAYRAHRGAVVAHEAAKEARESKAAGAFEELEEELSSSATTLAIDLGYGREKLYEGAISDEGQARTGSGTAVVALAAGGIGRTRTPVAGRRGAGDGATAPGGRNEPRVPGAIGPVVPRDVVAPAVNGSTPAEYLPDGRPAVDGSSAPVSTVESGSIGAARSDVEAQPAAPGGVVAASTGAAGAGLVGLAGGSALLGGGALAGAGAAPVRGPVSTRLGGTPPRGVAGPGGAIRGAGGGAPVTARPAGGGAAAARPAGPGAAGGPRAAGAGTGTAGRAAGGSVAPRPAGAGAGGSASARPAGAGGGAAAPRGGAGPAAARPVAGGAATARPAGSGAAAGRPAGGGGAATGRPPAGPTAGKSAGAGTSAARGAGTGAIRPTATARTRPGDTRPGPNGAGFRGGLGALGGGARGSAAGSGRLTAAGGARGREESEKDDDAMDLGEDWLDDDGMLGDGVIR